MRLGDSPELLPRSVGAFRRGMISSPRFVTEQPDAPLNRSCISVDAARDEARAKEASESQRVSEVAVHIGNRPILAGGQGTDDPVAVA